MRPSGFGAKAMLVVQQRHLGARPLARVQVGGDVALDNADCELVPACSSAAPSTSSSRPSELIRSSARIPLFPNAARLTFARTSFSAKIFSTRRPLSLATVSIPAAPP